MRDILKRFWKDDRGAEEEMNKLLILAFIALPLLALLIIFKDEIIGFVKDAWNDVVGSGPEIPSGT